MLIVNQSRKKLRTEELLWGKLRQIGGADAKHCKKESVGTPKKSPSPPIKGGGG